MTILDYYRQKQSNPSWVAEYQSTAQDKHGKMFNCINVNFRSLKTYYMQLDAFKSKDGMKRSEWNDFQTTGQEKDKQRIQPLKNAKLLTTSGERFYITDKGKLVIKINEDGSFSEREKWLIIYMLLLDFEFDGRDIDILRSVVDLTHNLEKIGIKTTDLLPMLRDTINVTDKFSFFHKDIFWLISFANDFDFINRYNKSTPSEKEELFKWIDMCSKNKDTTDCIAHKFISGGAYTGSMFNEDVNIILCSLVLLTLQDKNYFNFLNIMSRIYHTVNFDKISKVIEDNKIIFEEAYGNSIGKINKLLGLED